ncbi:MAG: DUF4433 domain-containing protein [Candidatus Omnitrophica bacterium]|nr:DUF4433 domain-containing protein [Candidatus Omnitrophota bacterium]
MKRADVAELFYITPVANLKSIVKLGILSNKRADKVAHVSVAMPEVQDRRRPKKIPGAGDLHDYVNLYFDAHNPMLSRRRDQNAQICILRVSTSVLDIKGVVISDQNAASDYAKFSDVESGLASLDKDVLYARYWTHPDPYEQMKHGSIKCAEVLVPNHVPSEMVHGVIVVSEDVKNDVLLLSISLPVTVDSGIFF